VRPPRNLEEPGQQLCGEVQFNGLLGYQSATGTMASHSFDEQRR
jgi:hypothetical protein